MSGAVVAAIVVVAVWVAIGCTLAVFMGRRGHEPWSWLVLGTLLGPFAIVLAFDARRNRGASRGETVIAAGTAGEGGVDVLVGADGSPASRAAARGVVELLGDRIGRMTLVRVVPYDVLEEDEQRAKKSVTDDAREDAPANAQVELVRGRPAEALVELASRDAYDLLAIGSRGHGRSEALLGSVATRLTCDGVLPVLVFGPPRPDPVIE